MKGSVQCPGCKVKVPCCRAGGKGGGPSDWVVAKVTCPLSGLGDVGYARQGAISNGEECLPGVHASARGVHGQPM